MAAATASTHAFGNSALKSAHQHQQAFTTLGVAALALGGGIVFAMKAAADAAIDFETSFAGVRKTVNATEPEFEALAQGFRNLAMEIPVSVNELNRIGEAAGQLGIQTPNILGFTRVMADLGVTTNLASDEAATALARLANITQMPQRDFDRLGSSVVALGNNLATTEAEIVEMGLRLAGAGKQIGLTEAEVLGFAAALSSVGIEAQAGGTSISRVMVNIANEVASGGEKLEAFAEVAGMTGAEFQRAFEQDAAGAIIAFIEGLGRISDSGENVFAVLEALGLQEIRVRDALLRTSGAGDILRQSLDLSTAAWEENNALTKEAEQRYGTTASKIQIATNRINDAAISFGMILLPAIAAVMGAVGDFANIIGGLPGPVKAVALALAAASAAALLLAGGTLILLPRIAAVKVAMAQMGIQAGVMRGSLALAARAINPVTVALTAGAVVLGSWAQAKANAARAVDEFVAAIEADTGALGENTEAVIVNQLLQAGLLDVLNDMNASTERVTREVLEMAGGNEEAAASIEMLLASMDDQDALNFAAVIVALKDGMGDAALKAEALGGQAEETGDALTGAAGATGEFADEAEEATSASDEFTEALDLLAGAALGVEKASLAWLDAAAELRAELREGAKTLDDSTVAGRENRHAILDAVDAAIAHGAAKAEETGSIEEGSRATRRHINELIEQAVQAGFSEKAIRDYIRQLNLTPKEIKTRIEAVGIPAAQADVDRFIQLNSGRVIHISVVTDDRTSGTGPTLHAGGTIGQGGARRLHGGGKVRGDEEWFIGQRGERVLSVPQVRTLENILGLAPAPVSAQSGNGGGAVVNVTVNGWVGNDQQIAERVRTELQKMKPSLGGSLGLS